VPADVLAQRLELNARDLRRGAPVFARAINSCRCRG
jgi:hypothetical protein